MGSVASSRAGVVVPVNSDTGDSGSVVGHGAGVGMPVTVIYIVYSIIACTSMF